MFPLTPQATETTHIHSIWVVRLAARQIWMLQENTHKDFQAFYKGNDNNKVFPSDKKRHEVTSLWSAVTNTHWLRHQHSLAVSDKCFILISHLKSRTRNANFGPSCCWQQKASSHLLWLTSLEQKSFEDNCLSNTMFFSGENANYRPFVHFGLWNLLIIMIAL